MKNSHVFGVVRYQRSVRNYDSRPIEDWKLNFILETARLAPSSSNSQPWRIIVVNQTEKIQALASATPGKIMGFPWLKNCPIVIVMCAAKTSLQKMAQLVGKNYPPVDIGIVGEHICLEAADLGIGSCWIGWIDPKKIKVLCNIPGSWDVVCMIALGYPANSDPNETPVFNENLETPPQDGKIGIGNLPANKRKLARKYYFLQSNFVNSKT